MRAIFAGAFFGLEVYYIRMGKSASKNSKKKKRTKAFAVAMIIIWLITAALNAAAFLIPGFANWYIGHITPLIVSSYGRLTGLVPFSVGEIMLTIAVALVCATVLGALLLIFLHRSGVFKKFVFGLFKADIVIITIVALIMTLNCSILYRADTVDPNPDTETRQYTAGELLALRNHIVSKCNEYSELIERGEDGYAVYNGDLQETAKASMQNIASIYPGLSGFYPDVKLMMYSSLMSQMYMEGYYFPFSMEANVNSMTYIVNKPEAFCHELSHLHGFIFEDEANFLSFLACTESGDDFFIYSGYMKALNYVVNAFSPYVSSMNEEERASFVKTNELVNKDNIFLTSEMWETVESGSLLSTETVSKASNSFTDTTLKLNGVSDGIASYSRVVGLLLEYYDGILY